MVHQRNGTILFEARTDEQIDKFQKQSRFLVEVTTHPILNLRKREVSYEEHQKVKYHFLGAWVSDVYRMKRKEHC